MENVGRYLQRHRARLIPCSGKKNIIAFSLYGDQPRYCETLIKNIETAKSLFPGWCCRVYLDNSVPQHVWQRLQGAGAQLVDMSHEKGIYPTLWRFLVMDDPTVERFLVRDADSPSRARAGLCRGVALFALVLSPYA
jgi:hypothetical protein